MEKFCMRDIGKIDLNKGLSRTYAGMVLATGDRMANCFGAALYRGGDAVDITGYTVTGYFIRKNGAETVVIEGKAEGNEAIVELPQACYTSDGNFSLAIKVSGTDVTATVRVVDGAIRLTQTGTIVDPGEVVPSLDDLLAQIERMETATEAANTAANNAKEFIVTVTAPIIAGEAATADKTFEEIKAAITAGKTPVVRLKMQGKIEVDTLHLYKSGAMSIMFRQQVKHTANYNIVSALQCIFNTAGVSVDSVNFRSVPDGGTDGQVLIKTGESTYEWRDPSAIAGVAPAIIPTATGSIVTITDGAARPAVEVISHIEPVQEGSGDPSPDNVRPISGWTAAKIARTGKNLLPPLPESITSNGITFTSRADGRLEVSGTRADKNLAAVADLLINAQILAGKYTLSNFDDISIVATARVSRVAGADDYYDAVDGKSVTFTVNEGDKLTVYLQVPNYSNFNGTTIAAPQLEPGTSKTNFAPYAGYDQLTASLYETVYGGKLDWTTGVLTVDHKNVGMDDIGWQYSAVDKRFFVVMDDFPVVETTMPPEALCSIYRPVTFNDFYSDVDGTDQSFAITGKYLFVRDLRYTTVSDFAAAVSGQTICYRTSSPQEIQLTPQQLSTLKGTNNVWSDCGDTTLSYVADTKMYIDQRISALLNA